MDRPRFFRPSVGALIGVAVLLALHRAWFRRRDSDAGIASEDRRQFLVGLGATFVTAGIAAGAGRLTAANAAISPVSAAGTLPRVVRPLSPVGAGADLGLPGLTPFITPNDEFYRIDTALSVPRVSVEDFSLRIFGMVDRELILSYADLTARAQIESDITLTCVSNEVGGQLVGNARWQGIRLDALLDEAGVQAGADQVVGRSIDNYTCGFPVAAATDGRDAMIAIGMNGEPLPLVHGFPARLVVPGLYGYVSATKWLKEIEITTFEAFDHYWARREWSAQAPIKTQSRIDTPGPLDSVPAGPGTIAGVAWAQTRGIAKVEVQIDDGPWQEADARRRGGQHHMAPMASALGGDPGAAHGHMSCDGCDGRAPGRGEGYSDARWRHRMALDRCPRRMTPIRHRLGGEHPPTRG